MTWMLMLGARVNMDPRIGRRFVNFCGTRATDADLAHFEHLTKLESLGLSADGFTDAGLVHLKGLANLEDVDICFPQMTGEGLLAHLKGLSNLKWLGLAETQIPEPSCLVLRALGGRALVCRRRSRRRQPANP